MATNRWTMNMKITWAIAYKDIQDAIKSKTTLGIMIGIFLLVINGHILPVLLNMRDQPKAVIFDSGRSQVVRTLTKNDDYVLIVVDTFDEMIRRIADSPEVWIGITLPDDFDQRSGSESSVVLAGYSVHWADPRKAAERASFFEDLLTRSSWRSVRIDLSSAGLVYPSIDDLGWVFMLSLTFSIAILSLGVILVPHLLVEEKERHTIDVLLISPASYSQIIAGKVIAGLFYSILAAAIFVAIDAQYFVHWELLLMGIMVGSVCAVLIGMVLGVLSDAPSTTNLWAALTMVLLIVPAFLQEFVSSSWPAFVEALLPYFPSVALLRLLELSLVENISYGMVWFNTSVLVAWSTVCFIVVISFLRRMDR